MPGELYALLVAIDEYREPVRPLTGCRNDQRHLREYLEVRLGERAHVLTLTDAEATRDAVVAGFRTHLASAGPDDVVLFAFSGHGSQERPPERFAHSEATGRLQNLMLHDAGSMVEGAVRWPLADKELRWLLETVAASGSHTVAILDCCHSGDATRDSAGVRRQWLPEEASADDPASRAMIEALKGPRPDDAFLPGALEPGDDADIRHVALYACQSRQSAKEDLVDGEQRGVFSAALLDVLEKVGSAATYRDVLAAVRDVVERDFPSQRPDLFPETTGSAADARFLDGTIQSAPPSFAMTRRGSSWVLDAGSMHGLREPTDAGAFVLACHADDGVRHGQVRVVTVTPAGAHVEPLDDWVPDRPVYRAVIVSTPTPLGGVVFGTDGPTDDPSAAHAYDLVRRRLASCGPDGGPSPWVREQPAGTRAAGPTLRVRLESDGADGACLRVLRADGSPAIPAATSAVPLGPGNASDAAADIVVRQLEHVVRWEQIRALGNQRSALADEVTVTAYAGEGHGDVVPDDRPALPFAGEYVLEGEPGTVQNFWVRLEKRSSRGDLHFAVLDLDDQLACAVQVEATPLSTSRWEKQFRLRVPPAGTRTRDLFKFVIAEFDFRAHAFALPPASSLVDADVPLPGDIADATAPATRAAEAVGPPPGPDSCAITVPFVVRAREPNQ